MRALSLNYRDLLVIDDVGSWRPTQPRAPVSDGVGVVVSTGAGVTRVRTDDRVAPIFYPRWIDGGPAAEKMHESAVVHVSPSLSDVEAATSVRARCSSR
jgi:NADPH:quinone reductase-like Zn-dependent oxidoreductase